MGGAPRSAGEAGAERVFSFYAQWSMECWQEVGARHGTAHVFVDS